MAVLNFLVSPSPQFQSVVSTCLCLFIHNNLYRSYVCHRIWLLKFLENRVKWQYSLLCTDYELFEIFKSNKLYKDISVFFGNYIRSATIFEIIWDISDYFYWMESWWESSRCVGGLECFDGLIFRQIWNQNGWYKVLKVVPLDHIDQSIFWPRSITSPWKVKIITSLGMLGVNYQVMWSANCNFSLLTRAGRVWNKDRYIELVGQKEIDKILIAMW